jgi:hypothetical protein
MTRFYGTAEWRRLRAACLARFPVCVTDGCNNSAVVADHVIPRSMGGSDSLSNLVGRCIICHNRRRGTDEPKLPGCNADGTPRDWSHWWKNDGKSLRAGRATVRGGRRNG